MDRDVVGGVGDEDIASRIDMQEVDNAVNITTKIILTRYDFRASKSEISLDKKDKKISVTTEDDMKMRAIQDALIENLAGVVTFNRFALLQGLETDIQVRDEVPA